MQIEVVYSVFILGFLVVGIHNMNTHTVPGRAFLDTSVINFMLNYGEQIYDNVQIPENVTGRVINDINALRKIYISGQRNSWQFAISPFTYKEVISTNDPDHRYYLENWFFEVWNYWRNIIEQHNDLPDFAEAESIRVELLASGSLDILPGIEDRLLICDAIVYRCDCFCTRDWKTILKYRESLKHLPIKIFTPHEWWKSIELYADC